MINEIIRQLRHKAGLTQEEVAQRARTPRSYISQIESGVRSPSERMAEDILVKGICLTYIETRKIIRQWKLKKIGLPSELEPIADTQFATIPILGYVPCGEPREVYDNVDGYVSLPQANIPAGHRIFAVLADGLSMIDDNIVPGDIIICDPDVKVNDGDMAIVKLKEGFTLKRVYFKDGYVKLKPANRGFRPIETSKLEITAKVIYIIKKY
jgi:SOS-response transcriptional repressor LexA